MKLEESYTLHLEVSWGGGGGGGGVGEWSWGLGLVSRFRKVIWHHNFEHPFTCVSTKRVSVITEFRTSLPSGRKNFPSSIPICNPANVAGMWRPKETVIPFVRMDVFSSPGSMSSRTASLTVLTSSIQRVTNWTLWRKIKWSVVLVVLLFKWKCHVIINNYNDNQNKAV